MTVLVVLASSFDVAAFAARRITVDQLRQTLTASLAAHKPDEEVVRQLNDLRFGNRVDSDALNQLLATSPGPKTRQAVRAIVDASVFLDPAPEDMPDLPAPTFAVQNAMMTSVIHYVARTLPSLPNFLANRVTERYVNSMLQLDMPSVEHRGELFLLGTSSAPISYFDGRETDDPTVVSTPSTSPSAKGHTQKVATPAAPPVQGLVSWGEFGPILQVVLVDAAKGKLNWAHWQTEGSTRLAVYKFSVDSANSHFTVNYCCEAVNGSYGNTGTGPRLTKLRAGYHGFLEVEPETGTVRAITILADIEGNANLRRAAMRVEYGPVTIGNAVRICPVRSVSLTASREQFPIHGTVEWVEREFLNDVQFTNYRRFGSESNLILASSSSAQSDANPDPVRAPADVASVASISASEPASTTAANEAPPEPPKTATTASSQPAATDSSTTSPALPPAASDDREILVRAVASLPGLNDGAAGGAASSGDTAFTLKVSSQLVDINLIALDKHDKPITNLKPDEIEIYDNGKRQQLKNFQHPNPAAAPAQAGAASGPVANGQVSNADPATVQAQSVPDLLILLIDESHLAFLDLNRARNEVLKFLKSAPPDARIALYSINENGSHILQDATQDHVLVATRLAKWQPSASATSRAQDLDQRNRQQIDTVRNPDDLNSVNGNVMQAPDYIQTADPALRQMGDNPLRSTLESMIALARHFAASPGHKSMVWITGDSALIDREDKAVTMEKSDHTPNAALTHTREVMNQARIALYAVDASAVTPSGGAAVDASLYNPAVGVNPTATINSAPGGAGGPHGAAIGSARTLADLQENTRAIQPLVRQLAESTGGLAINKGSDLEQTLGGIERHASALYELGFYPDTPADNQFHTLLLKVPSRKDVKLRYRTGYLYAEEAAGTKQRFQEAVWAPQDLTAISLTADAVSSADSTTEKSAVHLRVALKGLDLRKQDDHWTDNLYVFIAQRDDAAQKAEVDGDTLRLNLKPATYEGGMPAGIPYRHDVEAKAKLGSVRVIVVDGNSGRIGTVTLPNSAFHAAAP